MRTMIEGLIGCSIQKLLIFVAKSNYSQSKNHINHSTEMAQAIRQTTFVQSDGTIKIDTPQLPQGAKVEVIVILEDNPQTLSAEALAIERLPQLDNPSQLITLIEANQEIDEDELKQWIANEQS
ncbi:MULTISPECIES: hypothetical protein [Microcystis]|nr:MULTISPECIES: hypothetical protein [Microcystis]UGS08199.1 hypothetical protein LRR78_18665 [Microcystis aeruginosa FACHB-905 = DIANCHI905]WKX63483.1 hypothetical protein Q3H53_003610 [Microcystis aeruginosa PCC 7806]CAO89138.1 unnamed protein product [Microcystis aeruginosa PCC 7806]